MGSQRISEKSKRRIERATGLSIVRAWAGQHHYYEIIVMDDSHPKGHRHGVYDNRNHSVVWDYGTWHYDTCSEFTKARVG